MGATWDRMGPESILSAVKSTVTPVTANKGSGRGNKRERERRGNGEEIMQENLKMRNEMTGGEWSG